MYGEGMNVMKPQFQKAQFSELVRIYRLCYGVEYRLILREVQPTTQTLVHGSAIVLRGESQLGFDRSAE